MIAFSLSNEIDPQKLIQSVVKLINNSISSQEDANSSILTISIAKVTSIIDPDDQKFISSEK